MPPPPGSRPRPREVRNAHEEQLVRITWVDGHVSEYAFEYLRGWCPCAACQGHGNERHFVRVAAPRLQKIATVGNYALNFAWGDGHDTGIYSYAYLRELCPCPGCTEETRRG